MEVSKLKINREDIKKMFLTSCELLKANADELSEIDSKFGDGDHGITIVKIANAIEKDIENWNSETSIKDFIDNKKFDLSLLYVFPFLFAAQFILCAIGGLLISTEADLHVAELRIQAMDIIFEKDMLFFDNENSGEIASGIVYDISLVRNFVAASIPQFVSSVINILFSVVALTVINYRLSILVLIIFPAVMILAVP